MLKNYIKIAFRSLLKYKTYSYINIIGLSFGITSCLVIFLYVQNELSYDKYNKNYKNIYRVINGDKISGTFSEYARTPVPLASVLSNEFPSIVNTARILKTDKVLISSGDKNFYEDNVFLADPSILKIFTFPILQGNPNTVLTEPLTVLLTQQTARKYFGNKEAVGKIIRFNDKYNLKVTGVLKNIPQNSHFHFDFLISMASVPEFYGSGFLTNKLDTPVYTYLLLKNHQSFELIENKLTAFLKKYYNDVLYNAFKPFLKLQPLSSIHLYSDVGGEIEPNGDIKYIYIFSAVAILVLLMACINYMNILTARYSNRIKEVGVRKVLGADRLNLFKQFIVESGLVAVISLIFAVALTELFLPAINSILNLKLTLDFLKNFGLISLIILSILVIGIIAGSYPAFLLSSFNPSKIFRTTPYDQYSSTSVIKYLIVFQFLISTGIIISSVIITNQLNFIQNKKLGLDKENIVVLPLREDYTRKHYEVLKNMLLKSVDISSVSASSVLPGDVKSYTSVEWSGSGYKKTMDFIYCDFDFINTFKMKLFEGRDFSQNYGTDTKKSYLLNQSAVKEIGWKNPIGKRFTTASLGEGTVIGVVKDFNYKSLREKVNPLFIAVDPDKLNYIIIRIKANKVVPALNYIRNSWKEIFPQSPYEFSFFDKHLDLLYKSENKLSTLFNIFSALAIAIASLGLYGLASISTIKKTKEIGIRKILGASISSIISMIFKEFIILVLIANVLAWPIVWFGMNKWLQSFAYRFQLNFWPFLIVTFSLVVTSLIIISFRAIKAATANPVKSLRYE
ncbi:MAG: ABC transporter permease [Ignavibacteriaceae bacterium]